MTKPTVAAVGVWLITGDWLLGASVLVLAFIWVALQTADDLPVLAMALTFQWVQVTIGLFYVFVTGRPLEATLSSDYRPMVAIGLGCTVALVIGLVAGTRLVARLKPLSGPRPTQALSLRTLWICWAASAAVVGGVQQMAWDYPSITQAILAFSYIKLGLVYLILRVLVKNGKWALAAALLAVETVLGISGFFAGFREPIIMAVLALFEMFDRRNVRHWAALGTLVVASATLGTVWMAIRVDYRSRFLTEEGFEQSQARRIDEVRSLVSDFRSSTANELMADVDNVVDRLWVVYYPALALARVPSALPHTNGQIMWDALLHAMTPRVFFPEKQALTSDSELVRKYSGVWVAGEEEGTSIAFGYAAESYLDFGLPWMFAPVFLYGVFIGVAYAGLLRIIRHRDLAIALVTVFGWLSLYLFERSWIKTIGLAGTLIIYVGGLAFVLDRLWYEKSLSLHGRSPAAGPSPGGGNHLRAYSRGK